MIRKNMMTKTLLVGPVLGAILSAVIVTGCMGETGHEDGRDSEHATASQGISEREGGESGGEHTRGREGNESGEQGAEGSGEHGPGGESGHESDGAGGEEESGVALSLDETFEDVRRGTLLVLNYDAPSNSFKGTVENTTEGVLERVRVEVHLSNGTELGPTTPTDMAPGEEH